MATDKTDPKDLPAMRPMNPAMTTTAARAHLECTAGPEKGQAFRIAPTVTLLGRDASCEVVLAETVVSRQHARIDRRGETWVLKNLSANGTLVNKKSVDEVVLSEGDEIRLGAKTRLKFVVEAVATQAGGRPQFRARAASAGPQEEGEAAKPEAAEGQAEEAQTSLFKRRKGLFIGLGVYLLLILVIAAVLAFWTPTGGGIDEIPVLQLDDMVRPAPGAKPMRIVRESPTEGIWYENEMGEPKLVPLKDLQDGKAVRLAGIRKAVDLKMTEEQNEALGDRYVKEALACYVDSDLPGKEKNLFGAVRFFQMALACYHRNFLKNPDEEQIRQRALQQLIDKVYATYSAALVYEKSGDAKRAYESYKLLLRYMPDRKNPVFQNVSRRMALLRGRHPDLK